MATNTLPGITNLVAAKYAFGPSGDSFAKILADTLGNVGTEQDELGARALELSDLMDAFTADVTSDTLINSLPDGSILSGPIKALNLLGIEVDAETALDAASFALDGLLAGFGVWSLLDQILPSVTDLISNAVQFLQGWTTGFVADEFGIILSDFGPGSGASEGPQSPLGF